MILLGDVPFCFSGHRAHYRNSNFDTALPGKLFSIEQWQRRMQACPCVDSDKDPLCLCDSLRDSSRREQPQDWRNLDLDARGISQ